MFYLYILSQLVALIVNYKLVLFYIYSTVIFISTVLQYSWKPRQWGFGRGRRGDFVSLFQ